MILSNCKIVLFSFLLLLINLDFLKFTQVNNHVFMRTLCELSRLEVVRFCYMWMGRNKNQMNLLSEAVIVYTSEFERFITFIRYHLPF